MSAWATRKLANAARRSSTASEMEACASVDFERSIRSLLHAELCCFIVVRSLAIVQMLGESVARVRSRKNERFCDRVRDLLQNACACVFHHANSNSPNAELLATRAMNVGAKCT